MARKTAAVAGAGGATASSGSSRGLQAKENQIKRALLPLLGGDAKEVERIFQIIKQQGEY